MDLEFHRAYSCDYWKDNFDSGTESENPYLAFCVANKLNYAVAFITLPPLLWLLFFHTWIMRLNRNNIRVASFGVALAASIFSFMQYSVMSTPGRLMVGKIQEVLNLNMLFIIGIYYI